MSARENIDYNNLVKIKGSLSKPLKITPKSIKPYKSSLAAKSHSDKERKSSVKSNVSNRPSQTTTLQATVLQPAPSDLPEAVEAALAEITSTVSSSDTQEFLMEPQKIDEEKNILTLDPYEYLDFVINSEEVSLNEEEIVDLTQDKLETEVDFLKVFADLPDIEEISLDLSDDFLAEDGMVIKTESKVGVPAATTVDVTKSQQSTSEYSLEREQSISEETQIGEKHESFKDDMSREEDFEVIADIFESYARPLIKNEDDTFQMFSETIKERKADIIDEVQLAKDALLIEEQKRINENIVMNFIPKFLDECITKAERLDEVTVLRNSLDKNKLMHELKSKYAELETERARSRFLNRKTTNFFRRKGSFRQISEEDDNAMAMDCKRYHTALKSFDEWLKREERTKIINSTEIHEMKLQVDERKQQTNQEVDKLEQLIKSKFQRQNTSKLQTSLESYLKNMSTVREEISRVRWTLLLQQHQFSSLKTQLENLEDLGNGLNVHHYESLERETIAIGAKISEQNIALTKLHVHMNDNIHKIAHLKAKQNMEQKIIEAQKDYLDEFMDEMGSLRSYVNELKLERKHSRYEIRNLNLQSGLLTKPALLKDYDETVATASKLRQTNENLRANIEELNGKITLVRENGISKV